MQADAGRRQYARFGLRYALDTTRACPLLHRIIEGPDRAIEDFGHVLKHDGTTTVAAVQANGTAWVIKRYNTKNAWHALRRTLRRSRALNCWEMSACFLDAGIAVPAPVAYVERKLGPVRGRSYFLYEYVDAEDLLSYMKHHGRSDDLEGVVRRITTLFAVLRIARITHGDMKATNILVDAERRVTLLDLDAARRPARTRDFEQGHARDRSRFLENWRSDPELMERFDQALAT
jgi:tRNA A-37 threonylcarbamoyl transferase component Bud32